MSLNHFDRRRNRPALILVTDHGRTGDPSAAVARLPRGSAVLLRDYDLPARVAVAARLARLCRRHGLMLLVAGDGRLAARVRADGLHLPEALADKARRWRGRRPGWWISVAAHSARAVHRARHVGADAVLLAPVFATASHPDSRPIGPLRFAEMVRTAPLPVYALGGIDIATVRRLRGSGAAGMAAVGALARPGPAGRASASTLARTATILSRHARWPAGVRP